MKIKLSPLDKLFSEFIRKRANGICEKCLKPTEFKRLQTSHYHGRRKKSVRFNEDNAAGLCFACHQHLGENPYEHTEWFKKRLGDDKFELLHAQAQQLMKVDEDMVKLRLKQLLKEGL